MVATVDFNKLVEGAPVLDSAGDQVTYSFTATHTSGNVYVNKLLLSDSLLGFTDLNIIDAWNNGVVVVTGDDGDQLLEVGETWTIKEGAASDIFTYTTTAADYASNGTAEPGLYNGWLGSAGFLDNSARLISSLVVGQEEYFLDQDFDKEAVPIVKAPEGPGVGTPGFWSNNGAAFWDGVAGQGGKNGKPGFPAGELVNLGATHLILGGDHDNVLEAGELRLTLADAMKYLGSAGPDGVGKVARDAIASELNVRAGNGAPGSYLNDAVAWLLLYGDTNDNNTLAHTEGTVKTSTAPWATGALIHDALDEYNNTGWIDGVQYALDRDSF